MGNGRLNPGVLPFSGKFYSTNSARALAVAGIVLLVLCAWWWTLSVKRNHLANGQRTWIPPANVLGIDFLNNYYAARHWHQGGKPYNEQFGDPLSRPFIYSPVMLVLFGWCRFFSAWQAVIVWMAALTLMTVVAAIMCGRNRKQLNLWPLPLPFVVAALLCSTPIAFEMERGNCDMLVLVFLLLAGALLPKRSLGNDVLAGGCLALAVWIKVYAGVLGLGLLALRRPRAAVCMALAYVAFGLADYPDTVRHIASTRSFVQHYDITIHPSAHPFGTYWRHLWEGTWLAGIPGLLGAACALLPIVAWVSYRMYRSTRTPALVFPYLAWLVGVGTFLSPVSNDYNLFFLPVAALAVWDRRDWVLTHLLMAPLLLWWQPWQLHIGNDVVFYFKLAGVWAVALSIGTRCREEAEKATHREETAAPALPAQAGLAA
ncbi:MAG TPA: glycosyltransferase family 87 protein [Gemmataceae bacterium]|nr:glycosyltransferase family 87 protein [Gemmataceae bacterium]